jgi:hypothetical protein
MAQDTTSWPGAARFALAKFCRPTLPATLVTRLALHGLLAAGAILALLGAAGEVDGAAVWVSFPDRRVHRRAPGLFVREARHAHNRGALPGAHDPDPRARVDVLLAIIVLSAALDFGWKRSHTATPKHVQVGS